MCCGGSSSSTPQPRPYKTVAERQAEYDEQRKKRTWYNNPTPEMEEEKVKAFQKEFRRLRLEAEARGEMKPLYRR